MAPTPRENAEATNESKEMNCILEMLSESSTVAVFIHLELDFLKLFSFGESEE